MRLQFINIGDIYEDITIISFSYFNTFNDEY